MRRTREASLREYRPEQEERSDVRSEATAARSSISNLLYLTFCSRRFSPRPLPPQGISDGNITFGITSPDDTFLTTWNASIMGPQGTPYDQKFYSLIVKATDDYPSSPPQIRFNTKVNLPCVNQRDGTVIESKVGSRGEERSDEWKVVSYSAMQYKVVASLLV